MSLANMHTTSDSAQELHNNLCPNILKMLRKYNDLNGQLPSRIILYRDGVGDGQISYVVDHEVKAIKVRLSLSPVWMFSSQHYLPSGVFHQGRDQPRPVEVHLRHRQQEDQHQVLQSRDSAVQPSQRDCR